MSKKSSQFFFPACLGLLSFTVRMTYVQSLTKQDMTKTKVSTSEQYLKIISLRDRKKTRKKTRRKEDYMGTGLRIYEKKQTDFKCVNPNLKLSVQIAVSMYITGQERGATVSV